MGEAEGSREISCHVTEVPGVCKKGYWKATNEPTVPDPNLAVHSQRHLVATRYSRGPGQLESSLQLVLSLGASREPSRRSAPC